MLRLLLTCSSVSGAPACDVLWSIACPRCCPNSWESWPLDSKIAWHAAVLSMDIGISIRLLRRGSTYEVRTASSGCGSLTYVEMWVLLNGLKMGAQVQRLDYEQIEHGDRYDF